MKSYLFILSSLFICVLSYFMGRISYAEDSFAYLAILYTLMMLGALGIYKTFPEHPKKTTWVIFIIALFTTRLLMLPHPIHENIDNSLYSATLQMQNKNPYAPGKVMLENQQFTLKASTQSPLMLLLTKTIGSFSIKYFNHYFKYAVIFFDILTIFTLICLFKYYKKPYKNIALYAFNPLVLMAFSGQAHPDSLGIFLVLLSIVFFYKKRWAMMFFSFGFAVNANFLCLLLLPFLLTPKTFKWFPVFLVSFMYPFLFYKNIPNLYELVSTFLLPTFNGSIFSLLLSIFSFNLACIISLLILSILFLLFYLTHDGPVRGGLAFAGLFIMFSPVVHFWYIAWLLPLAILYVSRIWLAFSFSMLFYFNIFFKGAATGNFTLSNMETLLIYFPFYGLLFHCMFQCRRKSLLRNPQKKKALTLSLIIPVLNEEKNIAVLLKNIQKQTIQPEDIIIIDGGSEDKTLEICQEYDTKIIKGKQGRGHQIYAGVEHSNNDIVFILHADMCLEADVLEKIKTALEFDSEIHGGCVGTVFDRNRFKFQVIRWLNNMRVRILGIAFGDQGQFFRRKEMIKNEWFPAIPLMEDVESSIRIYADSKIIFLDGGITVSTRRWNKTGIWRNTISVIMLLLKYLIYRKISLNISNNSFYKSYYKQTHKEIQ